MALADKPWWRRALVRIAMTPVSTWAGMNVLTRIDPVLMRLTTGRVYSSRALGLLSIHLTTTGAKTGKERHVTLLAFQDGDDIVVLASRGGNARHPSWYLNLRANPHVRVIWNGRDEKRVAHDALPPERERLWALAVGEYPAFDRYQASAGARRIPVVVLRRETARAAR